ncbi:hypothetical protein, partial [uncultured Maricaulis sp.]|uniref:hypothetical protein n=1 Tax=uncultured Maricaulis sp. TaxID=174710 RepID=UPI0026398EB2
QNRRRKTLQRIGLNWWSDPPQSTVACVSLSITTMSKSQAQTTRRPPNPKTKATHQCRPGQGGRCLGRPKFEVNRVFQGFCSASCPAMFSEENLAGAGVEKRLMKA